MEVIKLEEHGYNSALYGFSLSYKDRAIPRDEWWCLPEEKQCINGRACDRERGCDLHDREVQIAKTATANAGRGKGHDKWLRQVQVWLDIEAPRYWWSEFDTYKIGTVAQSESTMHTLSRRDMRYDDCADADAYTNYIVDNFNLRKSRLTSVQVLKRLLPEAYLQRRVVSLNYAVLRCIIEQRKNHSLPEWWIFIDSIYQQCEHKELLPDYDGVRNAKER